MASRKVAIRDRSEGCEEISKPGNLGRINSRCENLGRRGRRLSRAVTSMRPMPRALISNGGTRLKKVTSIFLAAFFGLAMFAGAMPAPASAQMSIGVRIGPMPRAAREVVPAAPGRYYHWDAGHWRAMHGRWVWVPGHYVRRLYRVDIGSRVITMTLKAQVWVPGHYR